MPVIDWIIASVFLCAFVFWLILNKKITALLHGASEQEDAEKDEDGCYVLPAELVVPYLDLERKKTFCEIALYGVAMYMIIFYGRTLLNQMGI